VDQSPLRKLCGFVALCNDVMSYLVFQHTCCLTLSSELQAMTMLDLKTLKNILGSMLFAKDLQVCVGRGGRV
jgi:hypothetical protein